MSPRPLIALLTDFGLRDHYVGTMKGVALGVCPDLTFVDISHDVPAHDVTAAAFELAASYRFFPPGTIFLVVVDPGVGTTRRAIAAEASSYRFVGPDNGVFSIVLDEIRPRRVIELTNPKYARPAISRTFEGRDRFAPAAAWLATGLDITTLGGDAGQIVTLDIPRPAITAEAIDGQVVRVDRFGNLITNINRAQCEQLGENGGLLIRIGLREVGGIVSTYGDAGPGDLCALVGSSDHLEIAVRGANAAMLLGVGRGAAVHVGRRA